ncbi:MAG: hypothetical protein KH452_09730, partial [Clostridiales bacterium]|nr:hypothetical protein [Clostridiales bacterium]
DSRIVELDKIVTEVKESEEWEAVKMNILEVGIENGRKEGELLKLLSQVRKKLQKGQDAQCIADALEEPVTYIEKVIELLGFDAERTDAELLEEMKKLSQ